MRLPSRLLAILVSAKRVVPARRPAWKLIRSQRRYISDWVYALPTTYFFLVAIALCLVGFLSVKFAPASLRRKGWWQKLVGVFRFASYRRYEVRALRWHTPSIAVLFLLGAGAVFFFGTCTRPWARRLNVPRATIGVREVTNRLLSCPAMTLGPQPYYWPNTRTLTYANSPPIATRTGWMALACTPFLM